jgi:hypothetical protein
LAYKYPQGADTADSIIADIVATVAWIDLIIGLKLAHVAFPIHLNEPKSISAQLGKRFMSYYEKIIDKMSYRQKIDMFFELIEFKNDEQTRKEFKTLFIQLGKIRNKAGHNIALSLMPNDLSLIKKDSVGEKVINDNYKLFNKIFSKLEKFIENIENSMI